MHLLFLPPVVTLTRTGTASSAYAQAASFCNATRCCAHLLQRVVADELPFRRLSLPPKDYEGTIQQAQWWHLHCSGRDGKRELVFVHDQRRRNGPVVLLKPQPLLA